MSKRNMMRIAKRIWQQIGALWNASNKNSRLMNFRFMLSLIKVEEYEIPFEHFRQKGTSKEKRKEWEFLYWSMLLSKKTLVSTTLERTRRISIAQR